MQYSNSDKSNVLLRNNVSGINQTNNNPQPSYKMNRNNVKLHPLNIQEYVNVRPPLIDYIYKGNPSSLLKSPTNGYNPISKDMKEENNLLKVPGRILERVPTRQSNHLPSPGLGKVSLPPGFFYLSKDVSPVKDRHKTPKRHMTEIRASSIGVTSKNSSQNDFITYSPPIHPRKPERLETSIESSPKSTSGTKKHVEEIAFDELNLGMMDKKYRYMYDQYVSFLNSDNDVLYLTNNFPTFYQACMEDMREEDHTSFPTRKHLLSHQSSSTKNGDHSPILYGNQGSNRSSMKKAESMLLESNLSSKYSYNSNTSKYTEFIDRKSFNFPVIADNQLTNFLQEPGPSFSMNSLANNGNLSRGRGAQQHRIAVRIYMRLNKAELEAGLAKVSIIETSERTVPIAEIETLYVQKIYRKLKSAKENIYKQFLKHLFSQYPVCRCYMKVLGTYESYIRFLMKLGFKLDKSLKSNLDNEKVFVLRREDFHAAYMYNIDEEDVSPKKGAR